MVEYEATTNPDKKKKIEKEEPPKVLWRIYYGDYSTFDNLMGEPADAPSTGVICIVQKHPDYGFIVSAFKDFYWWAKNEWWGSDQAGFWQHMFEPGAKIVKFGVSVPSPVFQEIMKMATKDQDFGIKTAKSLLDYDYVQVWSSER